MFIVLIVLAILIGAAIVYLASLKGTFEIDQSIEIMAPLEECRAKIMDFKSWPQWSPWIMHEPDCKLEYSSNYDQVGGQYSWDGKYIGAGNMVQLKQLDNQLQMQVNFTRPFKSTSPINFNFEPIEGGTKVSWTMKSGMPFFLRPMVNMIEQGINMDYQIGLAKLKGLFEPDQNHPNFEFAGKTTLPIIEAESINFKGSLDDIGDAMDRAFKQLNERFADDLKGDFRFAAYHKSDIKSRMVDCDIAMPVINKSATSSTFAQSGDYYQLTFTGGYNFASLAWYSIFANMRMLKVKQDKSRPMLEIYDNDPKDVAEKDLKTRILIPIKS